MDLDELDHAVATRASAWQAAGCLWQIIRWPITDKPAASLRIERGDATAELILWVSGEADLSHVPGIHHEPVSEHYEITTVLGLNGCLDDLEMRIGL